MSAAPRVSKEDIVLALRVWSGDVKHAAQDLGIRRASLYERIERMGLRLQDFRGVTFTSSGVHVEGTKQPIPAVSGMDSRVPDTHPASWSSQSLSDSLSGVMGKVADAADGAAIFLRKRAQQSPRLKPEFVKELTKKRLAFQARVGHEVSNDWVMELFWKTCNHHLDDVLGSYKPGDGDDE